MQNRPLFVLAALGAVLLALVLGRPTAPGATMLAEAFGGFVPLGRERLDAPPIPEFPSRNPANSRLTINERGLDIIRDSEGLRLEAYHLAGQWLIGYGHAATAEAGMEITEDQADRLLVRDVRAAEAAVRRTVKAPLNENEFSALVSLAYNLGSGAFSRTRVVARLNEGDYKGGARAFRYLITARIGGERVVLDALVRRREAERNLFLSKPLRA